MPTQIVLPSLAAGMEEATLARWRKSEGDPVEKGEVIAEIETDKATMEMEAEETGILGRILVPSGSQGVAVNTPIALLLRDGEELPDTEASEDAAYPPAVPGTHPAETSAPASPAAVMAPEERAASQRRPRASPLARRLAREYGVSLSQLQGSGPRGRIVRLDVERARGQATPAPAAPASAGPSPSPSVLEATTRPGPQPMPWQTYAPLANSTMRRTMARRLVAAKQTVPHFYLTVSVELDALVALRQELNGEAGAPCKLSLNDFVVKAAALALRRVPAANAMWTEEAILRFEDVDIAVAVATEGGLITPVVRNADQKGLATISTEIKDLAARAREGKLKPEDYQGGGFTVSNLGMYGIEQFSAIINPPQSCILAVGVAEARPVARHGAVEVRTLTTCTLSVDHRSVDGAIGAEFLAAFKAIVERPLKLML